MHAPSLSLVALALAASTSTALAGPCKDKAACTTACDAGDPAACALVTYSEFRPLSEDKLPKTAKATTSCNDAPISCGRFAAHLWTGTGIKADKAAAIALWDDLCSDDDWSGCFVHAKAIEPTQRVAARDTYRELCRGRDIELACKAAGRIWDRVTETQRGVTYSLELPAVFRQYDVWGAGNWHVVWSASTMKADVKIELTGGTPTCTAAPASAGDPKGKYADVVARYAAKYDRYLPADWAKRVCSSLRKE